jgi:hypothetical protein
MNQSSVAESTDKRSARATFWVVGALILIVGIVVLAVSRGTNPAEGKGTAHEPVGERSGADAGR